MHSIVVVKCKHSSFSGRSPNGGMKGNISFFSLEKCEQQWTLTELANTLKNASKEKFLLFFIDFFFLLHIQFSRRLNWKQWSFTKLFGSNSGSLEYFTKTIQRHWPNLFKTHEKLLKEKKTNKKRISEYKKNLTYP